MKGFTALAATLIVSLLVAVAVAVYNTPAAAQPNDTYEIAYYHGPPGSVATDRFENARYTIQEGGALIIFREIEAGDTFLMKAYAPGAWISIVEID